MLKFDLRKLLDSPFFNELQDQMATVTGVSINTVDYKGVPILNRSCCSPFCQAIRENPTANQRCQKCNALAGLEAIRQDKPLTYLCHCGLVDVAVPIVYGDQYLGSVIFGQVLLADSDSHIAIEPLIREVTDFRKDFPDRYAELSSYYEKIPKMTYGRLQEIAELISLIVFYIISQKADHRNDQITYEWMLNNGTYPHISRVRTDLDSQPTPPLSSPRNQELPVSHSSVVYPAVRYIHRHPKERISMQSMASLCHLSPSYFSRTFQREVGENFNEYVNHFKVSQAKDLIRTTNQSIASIAASFGFRDTSYFIKVFKKFENVTPQEYKNHC